MQNKEGKGFLTFAHNTEHTDYVQMAYLLALSVKRSCKNNKFAVVVTKNTNLTLEQKKVFDHVIEIPETPKFYSECLAWDLTPFKETFKLESDMIVPRSIDHWWTACRAQPVVLTTNVRDYKGNISPNRSYRKFFDDNNLLDAYNGVMYFRYSLESKKFFDNAKRVFQNFTVLKNNVLKNCNYSHPDTDVVFGITATTMDFECSIPLDYPTFTHMKGGINGWPLNMDWRDAVQWHIDDQHNIYLGGIAQQYPFHYFQKDFCNKELIAHYEF